MLKLSLLALTLSPLVGYLMARTKTLVAIVIILIGLFIVGSALAQETRVCEPGGTGCIYIRMAGYVFRICGIPCEYL